MRDLPRKGPVPSNSPEEVVRERCLQAVSEATGQREHLLRVHQERRIVTFSTRSSTLPGKPPLAV